LSGLKRKRTKIKFGGGGGQLRAGQGEKLRIKVETTRFSWRRVRKERKRLQKDQQGQPGPAGGETSIGARQETSFFAGWVAGCIKRGRKKIRGKANKREREKEIMLKIAGCSGKVLLAGRGKKKISEGCDLGNCKRNGLNTGLYISTNNTRSAC